MYSDKHPELVVGHSEGTKYVHGCCLCEQPAHGDTDYCAKCYELVVTGQPHPKQPSHIIGFLGRKRSGKDTCADALMREFGGIKTSFAAPVKRLVMDLFNIDPAMICGDKTAETQYRVGLLGLAHSNWVDPMQLATIRTMLQWFGTDIVRNVNHDAWIQWWFREHGRDNCIRYITDVRFQNEVDAILAAGGFIVKLNRGDRSDTHESEAGVDDIHVESPRFITFNNADMTLAEQDAAIAYLYRESIAPLAALRRD
jgi:hypothetical protein